MRKFSIAIISLIAATSFSFSAAAGTDDTKDRKTTREASLNGLGSNWFAGFTAGTHTLATKGTGGGYNGRFTPFGDVYVGKWFSPEFGARLGMSGGTVSQWGHHPAPGVRFEEGVFKGDPTWLKETVAHEYFHADLLWNISNTIAGYNPVRVYSAVPYITLGGIEARKTVGKGSAGKVLAAGAGLLNVVRISDRVDFTVDLRTMAYRGHVTGDRHARNAINASAMAGFQFSIGEYGWKQVPRYHETDALAWNSFWDNWFVTAGFGLATMTSRANQLGYNGRVTPAIDLMLGKWFSPSFGVRLGYQGMLLSEWAREPEKNVGLGLGEYKGEPRYKEMFGYAYDHADFLWNFSATVGGYRRDRLYEAIPYVHMGSFAAYDVLSALSHRYTPILNMAGGIGLINNFYVGERAHLFLDLRALRTSGKVTGDAWAGATFAAIGTMGLTYEMGGNGWASNRFDVERYRRLNDGVSFTWRPRSEGHRDIVLNGFGDNWFIGMSAGPMSIADKGTGNRWNGRLTPAADAYFGKWFSPSFGARIGIQGDFMSQWAYHPSGGTVHETGHLKKNGAEAEAEKVANLYAHADVLWSLGNTFYGYREDRLWDVIPYVHYGATQTRSLIGGGSMARHFMGGLGLINDFSFTDRMGFYIDTRAALFNGIVTGDQKATYAGSITAMLGARYNIGRTGWDRKPSHVDFKLEKELADRQLWNGLFDNWFAGYAAGVNTIATRKNGLRYNGRITPAEEIFVGKWFNPRFGVRLGFQGMKFSEWHRDATDRVLIEHGEFKGQPRDLEEFSFVYAHTDFLWNFSNTVAGYRPDRIYEAIPYIHVGIVGQRSTNTLASVPVGAELTGGAGLINNFRINPKVDMFVDMRAGVYGSDFIKDKEAGHSISAMTVAGINYKIGRSTWEPAVGEYEDDFARLRRWAVSTNLLGWAALGTANLEVQYALGRHITADAMGRVNAWTFRKGTDEQFEDQKHSAAVGVKIWPWYTYSGLWIRTAGQVETYANGGFDQFMKNSTRTIGSERGDAYGTALSVGYSLMLAPGFNLDFGIGGWAGYKDFRTYDSPAMDNLTGRDGSWFVAPNELSISLMFVF